MIFFSYFSGILVLALWLQSRGNAPAIVFCALYGFGSGAFVSLAPAIIAQISDLREVWVSQQEMGRRPVGLASGLGVGQAEPICFATTSRHLTAVRLVH